jgi:hypothetical protein
VDTLEMKPKDYRSPEYREGYAHLYFWKLSNIWKVFPELKPMVQGEDVIVKIGVAKECRKNGNHYQIGAVQRAREVIRGWERAFNLPQGTIRARLYVIAVANTEGVYAAEQFLHTKNQGSDIWFTPWIEAKAAEYGVKAPSGKTEFYLSKFSSLYGKFLNCQRAVNKNAGWETIKANNYKGASGWKLGVERRDTL